MPRYFTVDEANQAIPQLEKILQQLRALKREIDEKGVRLAVKRAQHAQIAPAGVSAGEDWLQEEAEIDFLILQANGVLRRVEEMGVHLRHIEHGLVDFPALRDGREICLCWRSGEDAVRFWHGTDEGFANRKPISENEIY